MDQVDCQPDFCLDLFEPSGHGKRRRRWAGFHEFNETNQPIAEPLTKRYNNKQSEEDESDASIPEKRRPSPNKFHHDEDDKQFTRFKENIEYTVLMPGDFYRGQANAVGSLVEASCGTFLAVSGVLGVLLFLSALAMCWLAARLHQAVLGANSKNGLSIDHLVREASSRRYNSGNSDLGSTGGYTGRATTQ